MITVQQPLFYMLFKTLRLSPPMLQHKGVTGTKERTFAGLRVCKVLLLQFGEYFGIRYCYFAFVLHTIPPFYFNLTASSATETSTASPLIAILPLPSSSHFR